MEVGVFGDLGLPAVFHVALELRHGHEAAQTQCPQEAVLNVEEAVKIRGLAPTDLPQVLVKVL